MNESVVVYFDGLCEPVNPGGWACGGWDVLPHPHIPNGLPGCQVFEQGSTNNIAEYRAAIAGLLAVADTGWRGAVELRGDSQLVIKQLSGQWECRNVRLQELLVELRQACCFFENVGPTWVPREQNAVADALSREAYRQRA